MRTKFNDNDGIGFDFETYYDKSYSLSTMSTWNYIHDDRFDAYLLAVYNGETKWVGHPKDFDWSLIKDKVLVMHNASFDELVLKRLQDLGIAPKDLGYERCFCTADMAAYLSSPRDLKRASKALLDLDVSKDVRDAMKGLTMKEAVEAGMQDALLQYGCDDAMHCWQLWQKYRDQWPESEQRLSEENRKAGVYGIYLNRSIIDSSVTSLAQQLFDAERQIPWVAEGEPPLSLKALRAHGRSVGVPVPASLAKTSKDAQVWAETYGNEHPWIKAVSDYRRLNMHLCKVKTLQESIREDGTMPYQIKYFGASTGRFSGGGDGGGKFNMQNMPKGEMFGVDIRPMFTARPGHKLVIADYSQIEARMLLWVVGDQEFIDLINEEGNIYLAYAKKADQRIIKKGTPEYHLAKAKVLGLGYQCGPARFFDMCRIMGMPMSMAEAETAVQSYRAANPKIVAHWHSHQTWLRVSANHQDATHEIDLRSGRRLTYYDPRFEGGNVTARTAMIGPRYKLHSGVLTNNEIQATARDVMRDALCALWDAGYKVLWTVHDEIIVEVPESTAVDCAKEIEHLMVSSSPWAAGCPIAVEYSIEDHYCK